MARTVVEIPISGEHGDRPSAQCAQCLRQRLLYRPGIHCVEINETADSAQGEESSASRRPIQIAIEYDDQLLAWPEIQRELRRDVGCMLPDKGHAVLPVDGMVSPQSEQLIEAALNRLPGVRATASYASGLVRVEFDSSRCVVPDLIPHLTRLGYRVRYEAVEHEHRRGAGEHVLKSASVSEPSLIRRVIRFLGDSPELASPLAGGLCLLAAFLLRGAAAVEPLRVVLLAASFILAGRYTAGTTIRAIRYLRFDVDVLMYVAAAGAVAIGRYEEAALLLTLFGLGTAGENLAMDRARRAINALADLAPETAVRREPDGREREVSVKELRIGDHVVVRPSERIAADGEVISGASAVDQSPITGESIPVEKTAGSTVFAGTINGGGSFVMQVSRPADETRLARIIQLVSEAQTMKSPTQRLTDRVERWYVPGVLMATVLLIVAPLLLGDAGWSVYFYRAMAFLTAASPCALAIGTPAAVLSGIARAARGGVLIKGGVHLENLGRVRAVAFDKTGTLTRGRAEVVGVASLSSAPEQEVLRLAAAVEANSNHPLAVAITVEAKAREIQVPVAEDVREIPGRGVSGRVGGRTIQVVSLRGLAPSGERDSSRPAADARQLLSGNYSNPKGATRVVVWCDDEPIGVIDLADHARSTAPAVLRRLRRMGVRRTVMLTGDNEAVAAAIARAIGIDEYRADLLPEEKVEAVRSLLHRHGTVAMVGDGTNDAPALATATVGIAMGAAGTDVALETADVALMADDLEKLPEAIGLSRFSRRIIIQNLIIALGVILVLAPSAALGAATLGIAVLFHEGSTVLVVLNALRLLVYRTPRSETPVLHGDS